MVWFRRKRDETVYAGQIYWAFVEGELGDITPKRLRLPKDTNRRYHDKALYHREAMSLCALVEMANKDHKLLPLLSAYEGMLEAKRIGRGLSTSREQFIDTAVADLSNMFSSPLKWAQQWLMEFRSERNDETGVALFADHCLRQYDAFKGGLDITRPE